MMTDMNKYNMHTYACIFNANRKSRDGLRLGPYKGQTDAERQQKQQ